MLRLLWAPGPFPKHRADSTCSGMPLSACSCDVQTIHTCFRLFTFLLSSRGWARFLPYPGNCFFFFDLLALCWLSIKPTFSLNIQQIMCYEEPGILRVSVYAELRSHLWTLESSLYFYGSHSPLSLHFNRGLWHKHWQGWGGAGIPPGMDLSL